MASSAVELVANSPRAYIQEYFDAWERGNEDEILAYYSDDIRLWLPIGDLAGKAEVRDRFVRPFCAAFPGNLHEIQDLMFQNGVAVVEWRFKATHTGELMGIPASGRTTDVPGCSVYHVSDGVITMGRIYFNVGTMMEQIGAV